MSEARIDENIFCSNVGSHFRQDVCYKWSEKDNCMIPYFGDKYSLYDKIQLAKSQVDIDMILKRAKAGDTSVLHVRNEYYGDISDIPDNMNDLHQLNESISKSFDTLDPNIKALFNNDLGVFSQAVANGSFNDTINSYLESLKKSEKGEGEQ